MMRFSTLLKHPADWMVGKNIDNTVVVTSRIRLARNLRGRPFPGWSRKQARIDTLSTLRPAVEELGVMKSAFSQELDQLDSMQKQVMVERHLISREQAARSTGSAAIVDRKQDISIMINEEDHLRMQSIRAGLHLSEAYETLREVDRALEDSVDFAFDPELGYLTACPTNLGTGMRASAMLHLPGLVLSDTINEVLAAIGQLGLAVRGLFGEGTESLAHLFQISNQSTLGEREQDIVSNLERQIGHIAQHERNARAKLIEDDPEMILDKVGRAYGVLRYAHIIDSKEALAHLSILRLGADVGFFPAKALQICDELILAIQPAHLQVDAGKALGPEERDISRAAIIRRRLQSLEPPAKVLQNDENHSEAKNSNDTNR